MAETQTAAADSPQIVAKFDQLNDAQKFKFRFKKDKLGVQRPSVEVTGPVPSIEGVIEILKKGGKDLELLQEAMYDVVRDYLGSYVGDNEGANQENIPWEKFLWSAIANAPKEDRRSIPAELWEAFTADYIEVMLAATGKPKDAISLATTVYVKKFSQVKTNKEVLKKLQGQLGIYMEQSKRAEEFTDILEMLTRKVEVFLKSEEAPVLAENL